MMNEMERQQKLADLKRKLALLKPQPRKRPVYTERQQKMLNELHITLTK